MKRKLVDKAKIICSCQKLILLWKNSLMINKATFIISTTLAIGIFNTAIAQDTLQNYILLAAENNPALVSAFDEYRAALQRVQQVGTLPDPELSMGVFFRPFPRFMGNQHADITLMQMFPWFGILGARRDQATFQAEARFEEFRNLKNELIYEVKTSWFELYRLEEDIRLVENYIEILQSLEDLVLVRYETGRGSMADVIRVQMEIRQVNNQLALLKDNIDPVRVRFNRLLNRAPDQNISVPDTLIAETYNLNWVQLRDSVILNNPELQILERQRRAAGERETIAVREGRPGFGLGVNYMIFSERAGMGDVTYPGGNMIMPMVRITLPIYRGRYRAARNEARFIREAATNELADTENRLVEELEIVRRDLQDARRRIDLNQSLILQARQAREILISEYTTGTEDFVEVLRMDQQILDFQRDLIRAIVDLKIAEAGVERLLAREIN